MLYLIVLILLITCFLFTYKKLKDHTYSLISKHITISKHSKIKIAHISDLHYGRFYSKRHLAKLITLLNSTAVDLIVITGDLIDDKYKGSLDGLRSFKTQLKHGVPKYVILGNHDYKSNRLEELNKLVNEMGFKLLINNNDKIVVNGTRLNIVGSDDYLKGVRKLHKLEDLVEGSYYNILLLHEPDVVDKFNVSGFDLILCGHSHGGQIKIPFNISGKTNLGRKYVEGLYELNNTKLYVSSGVGMTGIPIRFNVKPSISIIEI